MKNERITFSLAVFAILSGVVVSFFDAAPDTNAADVAPAVSVTSN